MAEIDAELAASVKAAKTKRMRFAFVAKGGSDGALLLAKTKVPPAVIAAAKKKSGGTQVIQGACFGEDGKLVFEMAIEPPATLEAALKKVIQRDAGITQHCLCRKSADPELVDGDVPGQPGVSAPGAPVQATTAPPLAPPAPKPSPHAAESLAAIWKQKDDAIAPLLKTALAKKDAAAGGYAADYKAARALASQGKYQEGVARLDALSAAIRSAPAAKDSAKAGDKPAEDGQAKAAEYRTRLMKAVATIKQTNVEWLKSNQDQIKAVDGHLKALDFGQYAPLVEKFEQVAASGSAPQSPGGGKLSLVKLGKARLEWSDLLRQSVAGLKRVQDALQREFGADVSQQSQLATGLQRLDKIAADFTEDLGNKLDDVLNANDDAKRQATVKIARDVVNQFKQRIEGDELLGAIDGNELVPEALIYKPMLTKLREILTALG